eukprot:6204549-Pleurochrysis_carterae.AAC.4
MTARSPNGSPTMGGNLRQRVLRSFALNLPSNAVSRFPAVLHGMDQLNKFGASIYVQLASFLPQAASRIRNMLPMRAHDLPCSAYQQLYGQPLDLSKLRVLFCKCYMKLADADLTQASKLAATAMKASYLGYDSRHMGHFVYISGLHRITTAYHVTFDEPRFISLPNSPAETRLYYREQHNIPAPLAFSSTKSGSEYIVPATIKHDSSSSAATSSCCYNAAATTTTTKKPPVQAFPYLLLVLQILMPLPELSLPTNFISRPPKPGRCLTQTCPIRQSNHSPPHLPRSNIWSVRDAMEDNHGQQNCRQGGNL